VIKCFSKVPHVRSHRALRSCLPKNVSRQLSSEQSKGDVWIVQLDRKEFHTRGPAAAKVMSP